MAEKPPNSDAVASQGASAGASSRTLLTEGASRIHPSSADAPEVSAEVLRSVAYSGPLPHPEVLRGYADIIPNGPERIIAGWEAQYKHRHKIETRGQIFAIVIALCSFIAAVVTATLGQPWVAGAIVVSAMAAIGGSTILSIIGRK